MYFELHHHKVLDSTMSTARSLLESGRGGNHIVLADFQTSGKGRIEGRKWIGASGHSLLMTLVIRRKSGTTALPLRVGLGVLDSIARLTRSACTPGEAFSLALKWPNDLLGIVCGKAGKLCGILCESMGDTLLAGIGINLDKDAYPEELAAASTSIGELGFLSPPADMQNGFEALARDIAERVVHRLEDETWQNDYASSLWAMGTKISFLKGHPSRNDVMEGVVVGIDSNGNILLRDDAGVVMAYSSGEISSRT